LLHRPNVHPPRQLITAPNNSIPMTYSRAYLRLSDCNPFAPPINKTSSFFKVWNQRVRIKLQSPASIEVKGCLPKGSRHNFAPSRFVNYKTLGSAGCSRMHSGKPWIVQDSSQYFESWSNLGAPSMPHLELNAFQLQSHQSIEPSWGATGWYLCRGWYLYLKLSVFNVNFYFRQGFFWTLMFDLNIMNRRKKKLIKRQSTKRTCGSSFRYWGVRKFFFSGVC